MKFGVREICDVALKAKSNVKIGSHIFSKGEPVIYFDTAKTSSLESASTTVYAQGGKGNSRLLAWEGEKTMTFNMEDALISPKGFAILSGADLITAAESTPVIAHCTEELVIGADTATLAEKTITANPSEGSKLQGKKQTATTIKLKESVAPNTDVYVMLLDANGEMDDVAVKVTNPSSVEALQQEITVPGTVTLIEGSRVLVDYYTKKVSDATQIDIKASSFAGYYYLEASTLFRREVDGQDLPAEFIIPKAKIQSNFTFSMAATGDPSTFAFTMDAFPDYVVGGTHKVLAAIQILGADDNADQIGETITTGEQSYKTYEYNDDSGNAYLSSAKKTTDDIELTTAGA